MANTLPATCQCVATFTPLKSKMLILYIENLRKCVFGNLSNLWPWPLAKNSENICQSQRGHSMCMSNFMMIGWEMAEILHIEISWKHVSVTYDLDLWPKILKIFVSHRVPILNVYVKFHDDRLRNDWDITHWHFAETRTHRHGHYNTSPSPYGGRGNNVQSRRHQAPVCDTATAGDLWTTDHLPQGFLKWSASNQSV